MAKPDLTIKPDEIEWRVGATFDRNGAKWGMLLGYIDSRLAMEKLDLLDDHWSSRMEPVQLNGDSGIRCTLTVNGVSREDVGTASNTEPLKGAFSDALKRAAVHFGIGRELYDLPAIGVECNVGANGKVKSPKALPVWSGSRWTIDQRLGFVRYDHEPAATPVAPRNDPPADPRQRLAEAAVAHGLTRAQLDGYADQVGVPKGERATPAQIEQIIALIEQPEVGLPTPPATPQESTPSGDAGSETGPTPPAATETAQPAGDHPPVSEPAAPSDAELLAAAGPGAELVPDKPDYVKRAEARAKAATPRNARETPEPAEISAGL